MTTRLNSSGLVVSFWTSPGAWDTIGRMNVFNGNVQPMPPEAKKVFAGEIYSLWQWRQKMYDGSEAVYERLSRADTANVVGVLPNGKILMIRDEQPDRGAVITPAGGMIKDGESPGEGAKREFLEETGYLIGKAKPWLVYRPSGKFEWQVHSFIGQDLSYTGDAAPDPGEKIELLEYDFDDWLLLGSNENMRDLVMRIILLEARLDQHKRAELRKLLYE